MSTLVHVGGDSVVVCPIRKLSKCSKPDPQTDAIVVFGEIGTSQEEGVAELIAQGKVRKPVIAYIGGQAAKKACGFPRRRYHRGQNGTYENKVQRLKPPGQPLWRIFRTSPSCSVCHRVTEIARECD
ncbi:MAG: hypothetical protein R3C26_12235 [Calditrichia bacterium]